MNKREIPLDRWPDFLDQFARLHHGKDARITLLSPDAAPQPFFRNEPLLGLVDERHGMRDEAIVILLGNGEGAASHSVSQPRRIHVSEWNDAYSAQLEIESSDRRCTVIQVGPIQEMLPPDVITDGILLEPRS